MSAGHCLACGADFDKPSFSEGPKVWDEDLQTEVRFRKARYICPECFSGNITRIPPWKKAAT